METKRQIVMQKIMYNKRYGLEELVLQGSKPVTRREPFHSDEEVGCVINKEGKLECYNDFNGTPIHVSRYAVGEVVAVAQSYSDIFDEADEDYWNDKYSDFRNAITAGKGWKNKMFVKASVMPHHVRILDIRCERLQDITETECVREGVRGSASGGYYIVDFEKNKVYRFYTAKEGFIQLMKLLNGKGFYESNPYVVVYNTEIVD